MTKENRGDYVKGYGEDGRSAVKVPRYPNLVSRINISQESQCLQAEQLRLLQEGRSFECTERDWNVRHGEWTNQLLKVGGA